MSKINYRPHCLINPSDLFYVVLFVMTLTLSACGRDSGGAGGCNSIYYWRTTFKLSDAEKEFLKKHDVAKLYVRFFDVDGDCQGNVTPEATIKFNDSVPNGIDIVPTIYITKNAMEDMQLREDEFAEKILKRVIAMCKKNHIVLNELQLDCDWTKSNKKHFFRLCEAMKMRLDSTQSLSSTIRLHQLTQDPPPVDRGVLMMYNTGNMMQISTSNSIFSYKDIEPYLRHNRLAKYALDLDVAYPTYGWNLVYHPGDDGDQYYFNRIMRNVDMSSYKQMKKIGKSMYEATEEVCIPGADGDDGCDNVIYEGYRIRVERPEADEILRVKELVESKLSGKPHNNILYHLDEEQLSHYSNNEISKIYSRN